MQPDDSELIARFGADALRAFTEAELIDDIGGDMLPARPGTPGVDLGILSSYENLAPFAMLLQEALAKFEFGKHSLEEWREKYIFPRKSSVRRFARNQFTTRRPASADTDRIVNQSPDHVRRWVTETIIRNVAGPRSGPDPIIILAGGTGAGKSSLNKYITSVHFRDFVDAWIVTSRVEYRKLYAHLFRKKTFSGESPRDISIEIKRKSQKYVVVCCMRDLLYSGYTTPQPQPDGHTRLLPAGTPNSLVPNLRDKATRDDFEEFATRYSAARAEPSIGQLSACVLRACAAFEDPDVGRRSQWFTRMQNEPIGSDDFLALEIFVLFACSRGVRFYLIFDGFDFIQASDFLQGTTHSLVLSTLSQWIIADQAQLHLPRTRETLKVLVQVTMRTSTMECFWKDHSLAFGPFVSLDYYVSPPELRDVFNSLVQRIERENTEYAGWKAGAAVEMFRSVQRGLASATGLSERKVPGLFLENMRHRINYIRHVLEAALKDALEDVRDIRSLIPGDLAVRLWNAIDAITTSKSYRLVDVLLQSKNDRFANFVRVEGVTRWLGRDSRSPAGLFLSEEILQDNNIQSGYVGNIFNYHVPYTSYGDVESFLEKVRVLELLRTGRSLSKTKLLSLFHKNGWSESRYFDISLAILIREALIEGVFAEPEGKYRITKLGRALVTNMIGQMGYLENVFFGCLIPGALAIDAVDILRSRSHRLDWVAASIFHVWILLRLIRTAEVGSNRFAFERARQRIAQAVEAIVRSEARNPVFGGRLSAKVLRLMDKLDDRIGAEGTS